jgi:hypothetical protein
MFSSCCDKVMCINLSLESLYLFKKPHQNPLGSFKDLSISSNIGTDSGKRLCFILCYDVSSSFPHPFPLSGVGTTCFSSCCDKDSAIIFTAGRLPVNPPWGTVIAK